MKLSDIRSRTGSSVQMVYQGHCPTDQVPIMQFLKVPKFIQRTAVIWNVNGAEFVERALRFKRDESVRWQNTSWSFGGVVKGIFDNSDLQILCYLLIDSKRQATAVFCLDDVQRDGH